MKQQSARHKINSPILHPQQVWSRNESFKNWGSYWPLIFRKGEPSILLPNLFVVIYFVILQVFFMFFWIIDVFTELKLWVLIARGVLMLLSCLCFWWLIRTDPGLASQSDPVINLVQLCQYQKFCKDCKCFQEESVKHCQLCKVCIRGSIVHLPISKMCITPKNLPPFGSLCLLALLQAFFIC